MAAIKQLSAEARSGTGKGAARAVRRAGQVPAVIYGDGKPPVSISLDYKTINLGIHAGRFLTTIFDIAVDGKTHRVIPRDVQFDPVKDTPLHVDFLRLGESSQVKVWIPVHALNAETCPGVKKGGTVNLVEHSIELYCLADAIPASIDIDLSAMEIGSTVHLSDITLPKGTKPVAHDDMTLLTIVPPSGQDEPASATAAAPAAAAPAAS